MNKKSLYFLIFLTIWGTTSSFAQEYITLSSTSGSNFSDKSKNDLNQYDIKVQDFVQSLENLDEIPISIPFASKTKDVILHSYNLLSPDYQLYNSKGALNSTKKDYLFFHGYVQGEPSSKVTFTIYKNKELVASIYDKDGNYEISPDPAGGYRGAFDYGNQEKTGQNWECDAIEANDSDFEKSDKFIEKSMNSSGCTTIFIEIDHNMYNKKGSVAAAENWALSLMNQVSILYIEWNIPITISGVQVWDTPDPYVTATNTSQALGLFRTAVLNNPNFNGRLAHLLSGRGLGGGIAYLSSLCSNSTNVAVSANLNGSVVSYPSYSWNVMVVAHEMGHNFGSPHTHDCSWNGDNTAIDGCGGNSGCPSAPIPPIGVGGTIMSYCHLKSTGINLANGFGPQPGELIQNRFLNATCVTGENCAIVPPFNDVCSRAIQVEVFNYCVEGMYTNENATASNTGGNFSCGDTGDEKDVWYYFTYPNTDSLYLDLSGFPEGSSDAVVELYAGNCTSLISILCDSTYNSDTIHAKINNPSLIGQNIYIRIVEKGSDAILNFRMCLYSENIPCQDGIVDSLYVFYTDLNGASWTNNEGWKNGYDNDTCDFCNWYGITCDRNGQIIKLELESNNLTGDFTTQFEFLERLAVLDLSNNNISGKLPIIPVQNRYINKLDFSFNSFTDTVPEIYARHKNLTELYFNDNNLTGELPRNLGGGALQRLFGGNNDFIGCFPVGFSSMCYKDSLNFDNNINLVYGGDITELCLNSNGYDYDQDGFCRGIEDCNDYNANIYPGAEEILCDGIDNNCNMMTDEGSDFGPNLWIGPDTLGNWKDDSNWSMGHFPLVCELVEIGTNGENLHINYTSAQYDNVQLKSLQIGPNVTFIIDTTVGINIQNVGSLINEGTIIINGYIGMNGDEFSNYTPCINSGLIKIEPTGGVYINEVGEYGIHNLAQGNIEVNGSCYISTYSNTMSKSAIKNEGTINVHSQMYLYGNYSEGHIKAESSSIFEMGPSAYFEIYDY